MSTSEPFLDNRFLRTLAAVNALVPAALIAWDAWRGQLGVNSVNFVIRTTGMIGLVLIVLSLLVTPIRQLTGWSRVVAMRRRLGVIGFFYLVAHFAVFFLFDRQASITSTVHEILTRKYLWFGTGALLLMVPLALTSTDAMVSRLGPARWKALHRLSYLVAIGAVVHFYLLVKADVRLPLGFAAVVAVLLLYRVGSHYVDLRRRALVRPAAPATATRPRRPWSGELAIARIFDETPDVKTFRLVTIDGGPLPFTFTAGQYLNLALTIDGRRVNRSYTIASPPTRSGYCEISVKQLRDGWVSRHLHETWREGQCVTVTAPAGRFVFDGHNARRVVLIAGGIGITPLMSIARSLTDRGWTGDIYLLLSVRRVADIPFREELALLASRFPSLHVRIVVSNDPETFWEGQRGVITPATISHFVPNLTRGPVFVCGPEPMMAAMRTILVGMGVPDAEVLQEEFVSRPATVGTTVEDVPSPVDATMVFTRSGRTVDTDADLTVLEAAEQCGVSIPSECRSGICGQCKTRLASGQVVMAVQDALTPADRERRIILACQARALGALEVDA